MSQARKRRSMSNTIYGHDGSTVSSSEGKSKSKVQVTFLYGSETKRDDRWKLACLLLLTLAKRILEATSLPVIETFLSDNAEKSLRSMELMEERSRSIHLMLCQPNVMRPRKAGYAVSQVKRTSGLLGSVHEHKGLR